MALIGAGGLLLAFAVIQLLGLPGPHSHARPSTGEADAAVLAPFR
jgi:hypothetical protein